MTWRTIERRLISKRSIDRSSKIVNGSRCWIFTGCKNPDGYGKIRITFNGVRWMEYAHRLAAALWLGFDLNSDELICHDVECKNKACFNPAHLQAGDHQDNADGCSHKFKRRLTPHEVKLLRRYIGRGGTIAAWVAGMRSGGREINYNSAREAALGITHKSIERPIRKLRGGKPYKICQPKIAVDSFIVAAGDDVAPF